MKFRCSCGHVVRDQSGSLPYKAHLTPDTAWNLSHDALTKDLLDFIQSIKEGKEKEWILANMGQDLDLKTTLHDLQLSHRLPYERQAYQCPECHTLYLTSQNGILEEFRPASALDSSNILATKN